jgi:hypothetical protein
MIISLISLLLWGLAFYVDWCLQPAQRLKKLGTVSGVKPLAVSNLRPSGVRIKVSWWYGKFFKSFLPTSLFKYTFIWRLVLNDVPCSSLNVCANVKPQNFIHRKRTNSQNILCLPDLRFSQRYSEGRFLCMWHCVLCHWESSLWRLEHSQCFLDCLTPNMKELKSFETSRATQRSNVTTQETDSSYSVS